MALIIYGIDHATTEKDEAVISSATSTLITREQALSLSLSLTWTMEWRQFHYDGIESPNQLLNRQLTRLSGA